jgi:DNA-binding MarR family transcriptional regulator
MSNNIADKQLLETLDSYLKSLTYLENIMLRHGSTALMTTPQFASVFKSYQEILDKLQVMRDQTNNPNIRQRIDEVIDRAVSFFKELKGQEKSEEIELSREEKEELALAHMSGIIYATTDEELELCRNLVKKGYLKEHERPKHGFKHTFRLTSEGKEVAKQAYNEIVKQDESGLTTSINKLRDNIFNTIDEIRQFKFSDEADKSAYDAPYLIHEITKLENDLLELFYYGGQLLNLAFEEKLTDDIYDHFMQSYENLMTKANTLLMQIEKTEETKHEEKVYNFWDDFVAIVDEMPIGETTMFYLAIKIRGTGHIIGLLDQTDLSIYGIDSIEELTPDTVKYIVDEFLNDSELMYEQFQGPDPSWTLYSGQPSHA